MNSAAIGVFDSGIGGLTVMHALMRAVPAESLVYFGDTARVPYGPKSPDTVRRFARENVQLLLDRGVKMVVVACNTATAHALDYLRASFPIPVVGVIGPGARAAARATHSARVGVIGTYGTVSSDAYGRQLRALLAGVEVFSRACPLLVPLAEEGLLEHPATRLIAREYLEPFSEDGIDTLILGCTHYPLFKPLIAEILGPGMTLVDSAEETAREVQQVLGARGLGSATGRNGERRFLVSDLPGQFRRVGRTFLGEDPGDVEVVRAGEG
ncbi:MAG: glutamate racemase [Gemmatimonadetes bacterium]|nr:glutamate racemase [Gemmatimonadota bacterium]